MVAVGIYFSLITDLFVYFIAPGSIVADALYDLGVRNFDAYRKCVRSKKEIEKLIDQKQYLFTNKMPLQFHRYGQLFKGIVRIFAKFVVFLNMEHVNLNRMAHHYKLHLFKTISIKLRVQLVRLVIVSNWTIILGFLIIRNYG